MKKFIAIGLVTVFLLSATESYQLLKLPNVFIHFAQHRQQDAHISFLRFLAMHYLHGSPRDKDYEEDMKLPFKMVDKSSAGFSLVGILSGPLELSLKKPELISGHTPVFRSGYLISSYLASIWQPPRFS